MGVEVAEGSAEFLTSEGSRLEIVDGAGELGFSPPYSWWPLWCAMALAVCVLGVAIGWWLLPTVAVGQRGTRVEAIRSEAIARWTELLRDNLAAGVGAAVGAHAVRTARLMAARAVEEVRRRDLVLRAALVGPRVGLSLLGDGHEARQSSAASPGSARAAPPSADPARARGRDRVEPR